MKSEAYKSLSLNEFEKAAEQFDHHNPSVYNLCRKDYPDMLEEVKKNLFPPFWMLDHLVDVCDSTYSSSSKAIYETQWVSDGQTWIVDTKAYDETVNDGYQCSVCGATK
jgi:hypothetical protein